MTPLKPTKKQPRKLFAIGCAGLITLCLLCIGVSAGMDALGLLPKNIPTQAVAVAPTDQFTQTYTPAETSRPTDTLVPVASPIIQLTENIPPTITPQTTPALNGVLSIHYIDVGQGDAILVQAPGGQAALIDGGEEGTGVVQYLQTKGVQKLDVVIATHPHSDHIGGLIEVLKVIHVDKVITNGQMHTTSTYERFLDAIASAKADYQEVKRGDIIFVGGFSFVVLNPVTTNGNDLNENSIVLRLVYEQVSFLFDGDAGAVAEGDMLASGLPISANILKVGHHGSRSASSPAFLAQVKPAVAIYSAGRGNDYGHPHAETLANLKAVGAQIYGTDINGTVIVTSDGSGYSIETEKQGQAEAPPTPQPTVSQKELKIEVVSLTSPIPPGAMASITIQTFPGTDCTITVYYKSGASNAAGLGPQTADASGKVTWSWKVGTRTTPGVWRIVVTASLNGEKVTKEIPFEVKK